MAVATATAGAPIDYLNPGLAAGLARVRMPVVDATSGTLEGYGSLVADRTRQAIEIVRWPASGWRPVDADTGDQAGTTEGVFVSEWRGDILYGRNQAVGGHYVLAYGSEPTEARDDHERDPSTMLLWHANYHPDGGQLFFPLDRARRSTCRSRSRATTSDRKTSSVSASRATRASISIPTSGTRASSRCAAGSGSSISRERFTHASPSISPASSAVCWKCRSRKRRNQSRRSGDHPSGERRR